MASDLRPSLPSNLTSVRPSDTIERAIKAQQNLRTLYHSLGLVRQRPPQPEFTVKDYNNGAIQKRQEFVDSIRSRNLSRRPNLWRYACCYAYFLAKICGDVSQDAPIHDANYADTLRAVRQIHFFDQTQYPNAHPCDAPAGETGQDYLTCTVMLLKYTIYTRYQEYIGRDLESFDFIIKPTFKTLWKTAYKSLADEQDFMAVSDICTENDVSPISPYPHMIAISQRVNDLLGLPSMTVENAMKSFEDYAQHRHDDTAWQAPLPEVPTYELEDLIQNGNYEQFARLLHRDFLTLNALMRFETADSDIVHLQALISGLANAFFGTRCTSELTFEEVSNWQPNHILRLQIHFLRDGDRRFSQQVQWKLRAEAELAERKFGKAWRALCRDNGEHEREVQELLRTYLKTLGVEDAGKAKHDG